MIKKIVVIMTALLLMLVTGCSDSREDTTLDELTRNKKAVHIRFTNGDVMELEIYPDLAPETVNQFIELANNGFYEGTLFHRAIEGFMIQGGGYDSEYQLKPIEDTIKGEFSQNGFNNDLKHTRGVLSMARKPDFDSASSQFFIIHQDSPHLDGQYAAFGRVINGLEIVDKIATAPQMENPPQGMANVPVEKFIVDYVTIYN